MARRSPFPVTRLYPLDSRPRLRLGQAWWRRLQNSGEAAPGGGNPDEIYKELEPAIRQ